MRVGRGGINNVGKEMMITWDGTGLKPYGSNIKIQKYKLEKCEWVSAYFFIAYSSFLCITNPESEVIEYE